MELSSHCFKSFKFTETQDLLAATFIIWLTVFWIFKIVLERGCERSELPSFEIFSNIRQYSAIFSNIWQYSAIFGNIQQYSAIFRNIQQYLAIFGNIPQYLAIFLNIWQYWASQTKNIFDDGLKQLLIKRREVWKEKWSCKSFFCSNEFVKSRLLHLGCF